MLLILRSTSILCLSLELISFLVAFDTDKIRLASNLEVFLYYYMLDSRVLGMTQDRVCALDQGKTNSRYIYKEFMALD